MSLITIITTLQVDNDLLFQFVDLSETDTIVIVDRLILFPVGASTRTMVVNFASGYHKLYPAATIVIVKMRPISAFQPQALKVRIAHLMSNVRIDLKIGALFETRRNDLPRSCRGISKGQRSR